MSDEIMLSTGKILDPNRGYVGINEVLGLSSGYDQTFLVKSWQGPNGYDSDSSLTNAETIELANIVIKRWQQLKEALSASL